jgi:alpha-beta hydrolase superfamily lysophospholipase
MTNLVTFPRAFAPRAASDVKDAPFLALAHAAGASLLTGNLNHFAEPAQAGVVVLSPAEYLARLGEGNRELGRG